MKRVLVVDDKAENLYLLRALMQGHGFEVDEARHGAEALAKARARPPQLVVSDLLMPVMDGYTLLRQWKADPELAAIPFVVYTATYTDARDERLALDLGADAFILKPAEPADFMARIDAVLVRQAARAPTPARAPLPDEGLLLKEYSQALVHKLEDKMIELEQANRSLAAREAYLRAIIDTEPECVKLLDAQGRLLEMNPAGLRMIEADTLAQVQGQCLYQLLAPGQRSAVEALTARVMQGESGRLEYLITGLKGGRRWLQTHASPLRGEAGEVVAVLGITRDITEGREAEARRQSAEAALRIAENRYRRLVEANIVGVVIANLDGSLSEANDAFLALLGRSRSELAAGALRWDDITPPGWEAVDVRATAELQRMGRCTPFEKEYLHADGHRVPVLIFAALLDDGGGNCVCLVSDLGERKQAQTRLQAQLEELQRWQKVTLGREDRVVALKREVNQLAARLGEAARYPSQGTG